MKQLSKIYYSDYIITISQLLIYIFFAYPIRFFYRAEITMPLNINKLQKGSLLVANHQSFLDPFIILAYIPFLTYIKILPIRFPICYKFMANRFFIWLKLLGCFNVGNNNKEKMLAFFYTRQLLQQDRTIFLFPEGNIIKKEAINEFKQGIQFFINECQNAIFVRMKGFNKINLRSLIRSDRKLTFSEVKNFKGKNIKTADLKMILEKL